MNNLFEKINRKTFNIDLSYLKINLTMTSLAYAFTFISSFIFTYIVANYFDQEDIAIYRYIASWYGIFSVIALGGLSTATTIYIAKNIGVRKLAYKYKLYATVISFFTCVLLSLYYLVQNNSNLSIGFLVLSFSILFLEYSSVYSSIKQGETNFKESSLIQIGTKILSLASLLIGVFILNIKSSILLVISSFLIAGVAQYLYIFYKSKNESEEKNKETTLNFLKTSFHLTIMGSIFTIGQQLDKLILFKFFDSLSLAGYWIASVLPLEFGRFITQAFSIYIPKISSINNKDKNLKKKVIYICTWGTIIMIFVNLIYYFTATFIFDLLFPKYKDFISYSTLIFANNLFIPFIFVWTFFVTDNNMKLTYLYHFLDPILLVLGYIGFVYLLNLGISGIIYASIFKNTIMAISGIILFINYEQPK